MIPKSKYGLMAAAVALVLGLWDAAGNPALAAGLGEHGLDWPAWGEFARVLTLRIANRHGQ